MADDDEQPKDRGGNPPWIPTEENLLTVENMAARGMLHQEIADALGILVRTFYERRKDYAAFAAAYNRGKGRGMAMMTSVIFDTARKSRNEGLRLGAAQFYLGAPGWLGRSQQQR